MWSSPTSASPLIPVGRGRGQSVEELRERPALTQNSIAILVSENARSRTRKASAKPSPIFARESSVLFVAATARLTGMSAPQLRRECQSSMKGNARNPKSRHAAELPEFPAPKARPAWITRKTIAIPSAVEQIARGFARQSSRNRDVLRFLRSAFPAIGNVRQRTETLMTRC